MNKISNDNTSNVQHRTPLEMVNVIKNGSASPYDRLRMVRFLSRFKDNLKGIKPYLIANAIESTLPAHDITVRELIDHTTKTVIYNATYNYDYNTFCARLLLYYINSVSEPTFLSATNAMKDYLDPEYFQFVCDNHEALQDIIDSHNMYEFDFFGVSTMMNIYLFKKHDEPVERPEYLFMRVAAFIHMGDIKMIKTVYTHFVNGFYTHASPTMFNAGTILHQLASCFLMSGGDSIKEMYAGVASKSADISRMAGGIGLSLSMVRSRGSKITTTNGVSDGIIPFLKVLNEEMAHVNQSGKRKGAMAVYLSITHPDIFDFLRIRHTNTSDEERCDNLHHAVWVPDIFMRRLLKDPESTWSLVDPKDVLDLYGKEIYELHNEEFEKLYQKIEEDDIIVRKKTTVGAVMEKLAYSIITTSEPYVHYCDSINRKSNQKNEGTIKCSNLCSEINEVSTKEETAVCNLASISLPSLCFPNGFGFRKLINIAYQLCINLNNVIDKSYYPTECTKRSNLRLRPIGIGVQGLADVFFKYDLSWRDEQARMLNRQIFECIYYGAMRASMDLAKRDGPYDGFKGSPISQGKFQFDLWNNQPSGVHGLCDWDSLRAEVMKHGVRNSLLVALMPTASTSQFLGNTECFEPLTNNIYTRKVTKGTFTVINKYLYNLLDKKGLLTKDIIDDIIDHNGSVQHMGRDYMKKYHSTDACFTPREKEIFRRVWEIPMKESADMILERGPYVDQSQSCNVFFAKPRVEHITSYLMYMWIGGAKTATYYTRRLPAVSPVKFHLDPEKSKKVMEQDTSCLMCSA